MLWYSAGSKWKKKITMLQKYNICYKNGGIYTVKNKYLCKLTDLVLIFLLGIFGVVIFLMFIS